jgi:hypothetical protein
MKLKLAAALCAFTAVGILCLPAAPAQAREGGWCGYEGGRDSYESCAYYSLEQCLEAMRGLGSKCRPNPRGGYREGPYTYDDPPPRRRRNRDY